MCSLQQHPEPLMLMMLALGEVAGHAHLQLVPAARAADDADGARPRRAAMHDADDAGPAQPCAFAACSNTQSG